MKAPFAARSVATVAFAALVLLRSLAACSAATTGDHGDSHPLDDIGVEETADADDSASASCSATLPRSCTTAPSYATTIAPLMARSCVTCHSPGGVASDRDLTTYANVARLETTELIELYSCQMPPADAGAAMISNADRETIMQWIVCDYPNN